MRISFNPFIINKINPELASKGLNLIFLMAAIFFISNSSYGQHLLKGIVIDSETKRPLAFVNIIFNDIAFSGTVTNIDGEFNYNSTKTVTTLKCSYVGYENINISLDTIAEKNEIIIELRPVTFQLQEVSIVAGDNPANRIIRKVIKNKNVNNPENISSFEYTSYNQYFGNYLSCNFAKIEDLM